MSMFAVMSSLVVGHENMIEVEDLLISLVYDVTRLSVDYIWRVFEY